MVRSYDKMNEGRKSKIKVNELAKTLEEVKLKKIKATSANDIL